MVVVHKKKKGGWGEGVRWNICEISFPYEIGSPCLVSFLFFSLLHR